MPKKNANVLVPLKDGFLRFYKPASCSKSCSSCGSSTSANSWSKAAATTASKLSKEERAAKQAAEKRAAAKRKKAARAAALARKAAKAGRAGRRLHNDINQSQNGSGEDAWDPNTKGCHWRVEIRKPTIRVQIRQPYNSHQKNNQPW